MAMYPILIEYTIIGYFGFVDDVLLTASVV
jgi:hypothetical protein